MADEVCEKQQERFPWQAYLLLTTSQGASPRELILEACRRNNTSLLEETIADLASSAKKSGKDATEYVAETLNKAYDGVGNGCLHVAATYGSCTFSSCRDVLMR